MIKKVFPILAFSMFSTMLGFGLIAPVLPLYAEEMGATGIGVGLIFAGWGITSFVATPIMGRLSDLKGRKRFLCIGLLSYCILSLGYIWAATVPQLILVRLLQGVAAAMVTPIAFAYIGDISPEGEEGKWMGYANAAFFGGYAIGPLIGGVVAEHLGINAAFYSMSGLCLLASLAVILFLPKSSQRKMERGEHLSFKKMSASSMIRGLFSFRLAMATGWGSVIAFLPIFSVTYMGLSTTLIGIVLTTGMLLMTLLSPLGGRIADRFNRRVLIIIGNIIFIAYLALIPLTRNFWQLLGPCLLGGIGAAISVPAASALIVEEGKKFGMGSAMAIFTMAMSLGMIIGPIISGGIAESLGTISVFYFASTVGVVGGALFAWFTR